MAEWSRRERTTRVVEFVVPAPEPWGACWNQVQQAINQCEMELRGLGRVPDGSEPDDDQIRVRVGDEAVIVSYLADETYGRGSNA